jgi:hypothetical protein
VACAEPHAPSTASVACSICRWREAAYANGPAAADDDTLIFIGRR